MGDMSIQFTQRITQPSSRMYQVWLRYLLFHWNPNSVKQQYRFLSVEKVGPEVIVLCDVKPLTSSIVPELTMQISTSQIPFWTKLVILLVPH